MDHNQDFEDDTREGVNYSEDLASEDSHGQNDDDDSRSTAEFMKNVKPLQEQMKKRRRRRIIFSAVFAVILLGAAGFYGFKFLTREAPESTVPVANKQESEEPEAAPLETYQSQALGIGLEYPGDWQVDETEAGFLRLVSPSVQLSELEGQQSEARVVISISENENILSDFPDGQATAVLDSKQISYTSPTEVQRPQTNLSFLSFSPAGALDAVYVTGDKTYMIGNHVPLIDIRSVLPTIVTGFYLCGESACDYAAADTLGIEPTEWSGNLRTEEAENIIKSLSIK